jgi:hypothetical protein
MLGEKFDNDPSLEESKYTVLSIDCCSWIQDTEINACLEESEHAALNFSKIESLLTLKTCLAVWLCECFLNNFLCQNKC